MQMIQMNQIGGLQTDIRHQTSDRRLTSSIFGDRSTQKALKGNKARVFGAISSFTKRFRVKVRPVSETSDVIVCPNTLRFPKIFLWTENEPIQNPARWVILDDNRFSKELETFLRGRGEAKNTVFECLSKSHVDHSIQNKYFEFQIINLILKNKILCFSIH